MRRAIALVVVGFASVFLTATAWAAPKDDVNLQGFIDSALRSGQKRIVVPSGRYRVAPQHREHLSPRGLSDVAIIADGVEMVCAQTTRSLAFDDCRNLTLRGLTIDYDPLPFNQGRIVRSSPGTDVLEVELCDGSPAAETIFREKFIVSGNTPWTLSRACV